MDLDKLDCELLLTGYGALLDSMDLPDEEYGTVMARFFHDVKAVSYTHLIINRKQKKSKIEYG